MSLTVVYAYIAREKLIDTSSHRRPMDIFLFGTTTSNNT